ncbi:MAG: hypothetical protein GYA30_06980, partial [Chloroflexi bacterium]|nr:hypothetical protein [Chloroflexota bacterium]
MRVLLSLWAAIVSPFRPLTALEQTVPLWPPATPPGLWLQRVFLAPWERWDAVWYARIVTEGYRFDNGTAQFHPLYPWLALPVARLTGLPLLALQLVSSLAAFGVGMLLFRLARLDLAEEPAWMTVLFFSVSPFAFVLFAPYSEALFLLLAIACFWFLRRRDWFLAGLIGGLAALTRQQGILLFLPAIWELWEFHNFELRSTARDWRSWAGLFLIPLGLLLWLIYRAWGLGDMQPNMSSFHNLVYSILISPSATKVVSVQRFMWPWQALTLALRQFAQTPDYRLFIDLALGIGFIVILVIVWKYLRVSYRIYVVSIALVSFAYHTGPIYPYMGLPRHLFLAFPVFIGLGQRVQRSWQR